MLTEKYLLIAASALVLGSAALASPAGAQSALVGPPPAPPAASGASVSPPAGAPGGSSGSPAAAAPVPPITAGDVLGHDRPLTEAQRQALTIANMSLAGGAGPGVPGAVYGQQGAVTYTFGAYEPDIVCAVLEVCDVALEAGEKVNSINIGDSARWTVEPAVSGEASSEVEHLIIKPLAIGLSTSIVVATDRRVYHMRLTSREHDYMARVAFTYPEETEAKWRDLQARQAAQALAMQQAAARAREDEALPPVAGVAGPSVNRPGVEYLSNLDFGYRIVGQAPWKPVRVYNDGVKTIIEMPRAMSQTEAPSLLVVRKGGNVGNANDTTLVNYRLQDGRYVVDQVVDEAVLVVGVGRHQERVTIVRDGRG